MTSKDQSDTDAGEPFHVTLARGLGMARNPLPIQTILAKHRRKLFKINRGRRQKLAAELQQEYCRRRARIEGNERSLRILNEQYTNVQCFVTRIHCLPLEILMNIFYIILDDHPSPVVLMLVCRRWHNAVEAMSGVQNSLKLHTWTPPEIVRRATSGVASRLLNVTVDTDKDDDLTGLSIERYSTIAIAMESAPHWRSLTVQSLPRGGQLDDSILHRIRSTDFPPMMRLEELRITSAVDPSPLVDHLLQSIAATAMRRLTTIEIKCLYASQFLLRVIPDYIFHSLTTLKAILPKASEPIDILPRFTRLEVLEVTNLSLPSYHNESPLPFTQTLRRLSLKSVTIEWMAGRVFPLLSFCAITAPPNPFLAHDVHLPTCREFHFSHHCTAVFGRFQVPMINSLAVHSNHWTPLRGTQGLVDMCMAGLGASLQPRVLHLAMLCNGSMLGMVLQNLPALEELSLELPRPSALSRSFFTSLLGKPVTIPDRTKETGWWAWAKKQIDWHAVIFPSLKVFNLHYQRWLRPNEQISFVAPLLALGWSRKKTAMPLRSLCIHMKVDNWTWNKVNLVPMKVKRLIELDIPQLQHLGQLGEFDLQFVFQAYLTSATLSVIEGDYYMNPIPHLTEAVFGMSFHRIRVLCIDQPPSSNVMLKVLHCFHHLEELSLKFVQIYSHGIEFPLLQTLQRLHITGGGADWMDGHTFVQLKYFSVKSISSWPNSFPKRVDMPICTHIYYEIHSLQFLPIFQAAFHFPLMCEWTLVGFHFEPGTRLGDQIHALSNIHAQIFHLSCFADTPQLVMIIQPRYGLEELSIQISDQAMAKEFFIALTEVIVDYSLKNRTNTSFDTQTTPKLEDAIDHTGNQSEGKKICPNLKVLRLRCWIDGGKQRDEVKQWCMEMMESRRQAGFPLDRCCIWWGSYGTWEKEPSLILFTLNEG